MCAPFGHHAMCAQISERYTCCFVHFSFLLCRSVSGSCPPTPVWLCLNSYQIFIFWSFTHTHCRQPCRLVESDLTTHCPCQLKTGPVSSVQIHMSIVYTTLFTSSLIVIPSRCFRMCGFFSSSTTTFSALTTFCNENERFDNTRSSERHAPLNSSLPPPAPFFLKRISFFFRCHKFLWRCFAFDTWEVCFRHHMVRGSGVHGDSDRHPSVELLHVLCSVFFFLRCC